MCVVGVGVVVRSCGCGEVRLRRWVWGVGCGGGCGEEGMGRWVWGGGCGYGEEGVGVERWVWL